ncbi:MAG: hypothetical protein J5710_06080 [Treponema sp.]|nr:hypothetical protein [Treponema sp.]
MKKFFIFLNILIFFSIPFFPNENFQFSLNTKGGTLFIDKTGKSFDYGSSFDMSIDTSKPDSTNSSALFINAGYYGANFNLKSFNSKLQNVSLNTGFTSDRWKLSFGGAFGNLPGKTTVYFENFKATINDFSYNCGFTSFSYIFTDDIRTQLTLIAANQKSNQGDLYYFFGHFNIPSLYGCLLKITLPFDFYLDSGCFISNIAIFSQIENQIGDGIVNLYDCFLGKNWIFSTNHQLDSKIGFVYCDLKGLCTLTSQDQNEMLFPFSYFHADCNSNLEFLSLGADYTFQSGNLSFSINSLVLVNVYTYLHYYLKETYKKNMFYDGSIERHEDTISFSRCDSLLTLNARLDYYANFSSSFKTNFFISKKFLIPILSSSTNELFSDFVTSQPTESTSSQTSFYLKTVLLSGITFGVSLYF